MLNIFKPCWFVILQNVKSTNSYSEQDEFIARAWTAWAAMDVIKKYRDNKERNESGSKWQILTMRKV